MRTAILISGGGTTVEAILTAWKKGALKGLQPVVVISSREDAGGIQRVKPFGIPTVVTRAEKLLPVLEKYEVALVSQNGWLPLTPSDVVKRYRGAIINQHPGPLDPGRGHDFGGKGMYGRRVMCTRLLYCQLTGEDFWTEATTHIVAEAFDEGELIKTDRMELPVIDRKTPSEEIKKLTDVLQRQLFPLEYRTVIDTLEEFLAGTVKPFTRTKSLIPVRNHKKLDMAKQLAISLFPHG